MIPIIAVLLFAAALVVLAFTTTGSESHVDAEKQRVDREVDMHFYTLPGFVNEGTKQL